MLCFLCKVDKTVVAGKLLESIRSGLMLELLCSTLEGSKRQGCRALTWAEDSQQLRWTSTDHDKADGAAVAVPRLAISRNPDNGVWLHASLCQAMLNERGMFKVSEPPQDGSNEAQVLSAAQRVDTGRAGAPSSS